MSKILTKIIINVALLYISTLVFPNVLYNSMTDLVIAGSVLWMINLFIRPLILLISLPINILTIGLFTFVVNTWMLLITDFIVQGIKIPNFTTALFISFIISFGNLVGKKLK
ncbi:phage holin family protein [Alkalibaculum sp. M08DMB]|uniref:Phage holin family protein n=1 Tax=Alkalibaculum sporogenes TaxID=2655001 RepID=A0A6A7KBI6_9FIRM|nr:phage holin family protein [Alkalibaculum sporogenes]MPW26766.1 phage holin family protein [Alkalibaculum sporogenes]